MFPKKRFRNWINNSWYKYTLVVLVFLLSALTQNKSVYHYKNSEADSRAAINYINSLRKQYGKAEIQFDQRAFELAIARAKDMREYNYYDHTNPHTGNCPDKMKSSYELNPEEYVAENIVGYADYSENIFRQIKFQPVTNAVDSWMNSRGHRYNLLYDKHIGGAVGCHKDKCVFLGLNYDKFGSGCHTAAVGKQHWQTVPLQPGEVNWTDPP